MNDKKSINDREYKVVTLTGRMRVTTSCRACVPTGLRVSDRWWAGACSADHTRCSAGTPGGSQELPAPAQSGSVRTLGKPRSRSTGRPSELEEANAIKANK